MSGRYASVLLLFFISSSSKTLCSGSVLGALLTPCALHGDGVSADSRYNFISSAVSPSLPIVTAAGLDRRVVALADLRSIAAPVVVDPAAPPQPEPAAPATALNALCPKPTLLNPTRPHSVTPAPPISWSL
ncbi:hypothetical protein DFH09DRAFT_1322757 [Mycena vulgaris]|nr:hypothetical protein DFH09DRAFT_1322757 [Mycena vulgaris]